MRTVHQDAFKLSGITTRLTECYDTLLIADEWAGAQQRNSSGGNTRTANGAVAIGH